MATYPFGLDSRFICIFEGWEVDAKLQVPVGLEPVYVDCNALHPTVDPSTGCCEEHKGRWVRVYTTAPLHTITIPREKFDVAKSLIQAGRRELSVVVDFLRAGYILHSNTAPALRTPFANFICESLADDVLSIEFAGALEKQPALLKVLGLDAASSGLLEFLADKNQKLLSSNEDRSLKTSSPTREGG